MSMSWVTRWEDWRTALGPRGSRQRRDVEKLLETRPMLMYWGDSWFSTPLYLNLARQSARRIDGMGILLGKPGATAEKLFSRKAIEDQVARLRNSPFDLLCISAGGNDNLSERLQKVFAPWMKPRAPAKLSAQDAFDILLASGNFNKVRARYTALLDALEPLRRKRPQLRVLGHSYALLQQIGVPADLTVKNIGLIAWIKDDVGPWLWGPMQHVLKDKQEGKRFADLMLLQGFKQQVLDTLANDPNYKGFFHYADFTGLPEASRANFWYDEIHPTEDGFAVLAEQLNKQMRSALPASKRAAVG